MKNCFTSEFLTEATGGRLLGAPFSADRLGKDTRENLEGALYIALVGDRFDGHDFITQALQAGATAALVDTEHVAKWSQQQTPDGNLIAVADTQRALLDLAAAHLKSLAARRIALTGSNGKTTSKEMIASICRAAFGEDKVHATKGNLNNLIGLPLTALELTQEHRVAVLEMGMNHSGEIAAMASAAQPHIGLVTNIHPAHLEGLGNLEGIAAAKGELFASLLEDATAVVNLDDPHCVQQSERAAGPKVTFGRDSRAQVALLNTEPEAQGGQVLELRLPQGAVRCRIAHEGPHNASNAMAAAAVGVAMGISGEHIVAGLQAAPVVAGRLCIKRAGQVSVIDDSYNANPASMQAALAVATQRAQGGRLLAVLGEMRELGADSQQLHWQLGQAVAQAGVAKTWFCGGYADDFARGALDGGLRPSQVITADADQVRDEVGTAVRAGDTVLIKGSRSNRLERIVEHLLEAGGRGEN